MQIRSLSSNFLIISIDTTYKEVLDRIYLFSDISSTYFLIIKIYSLNILHALLIEDILLFYSLIS